MCIVKKIQKVSTINMESFGKVHNYFTTQNLLFAQRAKTTPLLAPNLLSFPT